MTTIAPGDTFEDAKGQSVTVDRLEDDRVYYTTSKGDTGWLSTFAFIQVVLLNATRKVKP